MNSRIVVRCTGACLGLTRSQRPRLVLAPEASHVLAPRDLTQCVSIRCQHGRNVWGTKSGILHAHARLNHISPLSYLLICP
jgi:hypothetical protein